MPSPYNLKFKNLMQEKSALDSTEEEGGGVAQVLGHQKAESLAVAAKKAKAVKALQGKTELAAKGVEMGSAALGLEGSVAGGALGGAASGAATGAQFGVTGAIVGGAIGGIAGGLGASAQQKAAHKAAKQRAKAQHAQNLGRIEQEKDSKIQNALESMKSAFGRNLNQKTKVSL
jgi:hypothetical protein